MKRRIRRPSPAGLISAIALVAAMSGTAVALPGSGNVDSNDIKRGAVKTQALHHRAVTTQKINRQAVRGGKIARNAVKGGKIRNGAVKSQKILDGAVVASKVANDAIDDSKIADRATIPLHKVAAATGANFDAARTAATPTELFKKGPFTLYAKCFTDTTADETHAYVYAATTAAGSLLAAGEDTLTGDPFLDPGTVEVDREVFEDEANNNATDGFRTMFELTAPDGMTLRGQVAAYAKNGDLAGGNGVYGAGDACLFTGNVIG